MPAARISAASAVGTIDRTGTFPPLTRTPKSAIRPARASARTWQYTLLVLPQPNSATISRYVGGRPRSATKS